MDRNLEIRCSRCGSRSLIKKPVTIRNENQILYYVQECRCRDCGHITEFEVKYDELGKLEK